MDKRDDYVDTAVKQRFEELYSRACGISRAVDAEARLQSAPCDYGLGELNSITEAQMMVAICDNDGVTVGQLAEMSDHTPSAVSQVVTKLIKKGYLHKTRSKANYRAYHLYPTEKGRQLAESRRKYDVEQTAIIHEYLLRSCSRAELDAFYKVLDLRTRCVAQMAGGLKKQ